MKSPKELTYPSFEKFLKLPNKAVQSQSIKAL
jgi:hypothetical protein